MDRSQKEKLIASLSKTFKDAELVVITQQSGLTVSEVTDLRRQMRAAGAGFKVAKNRLTRRALEGTRFHYLSSMFKGPTAIAFSRDPVAAAKVAVEFANRNEKLTIVGGGLGERSLDVANVKALATLPSLSEMRAKLLGLIAAPATKLATMINAPASQLARVIDAHVKKAGGAT
ncbi:MAG TPA: 50S ribosomal protein L10 [Alphaproteobacteria bacterium]|nr:50S ribosomal protein L10 [Alphaproteobacteria bacterium]